MATLRLELEIDSDVYPELYARLASIGRVGARQEKLRQLAATGLVWELVRMHGPGLVDLGDAAAAGTPVTAPAPAPRPSTRAAAPRPGGPAPTPDLGISARPVGSSAPHTPEVTVPTNLPVLLDVVDEGGPLPPPRELPSVTVATVVALRGDLEQPEVMDGGADEAPPASLALAPRSGRSSRLKRMKDKGLFHNG